MKSLISPRGIGWASLVGKFGVVQVLVQLLGFASGLLLVRMMSKEAYALYTLSNAMLGTMAVLADSGVGSGAMAVAGRVWNDSVKLGQVVKTAISLRHIFALAAIVVLSPVLFLWLGAHGAGTVEAATAALIIALTLYIQTGNAIFGLVPRILLQTDRLQMVEFFTALVRLAAVCAVSLLFLNLTTALLATAVAAAFQWALLLGITKNDFQQNVGVDPEIRTTILKTVTRHAPSAVYFCIQSHVVVGLLGIFGTSATIADAGALGRLAVVFTIVGNILASLVMPRFSRCQSAGLLWRRYHQVLGLLVLALSFLVLAALLFPKPMLWILGNKYQNLENEFFLMVVAQSLNCLLMAVSSLNLGRGWITPPWIVIPAGILSYTLLFLWVGAFTLSQVLMVGILASLVSIVINYTQAIVSICRMKTEKKEP
jgi:O-antigen/teichoic acid export membrane protein